MKKKQQGFTLFELIIVVIAVVLVIFASISRIEATLKRTHELAVTLNGRALRDGVLHAKEIQMLDGLNGQVYNLPRFDEGTLDLSAGGFPAGTSRQPGDHLTAQHCNEIWRALMDRNPEQKDSSASEYFDVAVEPTGKNLICRYSYKHGGDMSVRYDPETGEVTVDAQFK